MELESKWKSSLTLHPCVSLSSLHLSRVVVVLKMEEGVAVCFGPCDVAVFILLRELGLFLFFSALSLTSSQLQTVGLY